MKHVLIVDPDAAYRDLVQRLAGKSVEIEAAGDFQTAYDRLVADPPGLLVANLRLRATVEGLQLAYVVASAGCPTRAVVYSNRVESWVTRELRRVGGFYEFQWRLPYALPAYAQATLPVLDRRDPATPDRRAAYRGGRRASDVPLLSG